ncbi:MAG TPA: ATP-binding protein [Polyangiaceae bacterium]|nr:ATP-binding protein [Polyangiaceae bacterium]
MPAADEIGYTFAEMTLVDWASLVTCIGQLAVAVLAFSHRAQSRLSFLLALLSLSLFTWNFASLAYHFTHRPAWHWLDVMTSPLTPPLALHLIATFVGRARELRRGLAAAYAAGALLALSQLAPALGPAWAPSYFALAAAAGVAAARLLVRHLGSTSDARERARTRALLAAIAGALAIGAVDLVAPHAAPLSTVASLVGFALVAAVASRLRLLGRATLRGPAAFALAAAALGAIGALAAFRYLRAEVAAPALGATSVGLVAAAALRKGAASAAAERERVARLASMGRFAGQLAHDLKNPMAALKGALQFLNEERAQGRGLEAHAHFLDLMLDQVTRLERVVDQYERLGRVEPRRAPLDLNDLVRRVVALQAFTGPVEVVTSLAEGLPACRADADLVAGALDNVLRNAAEAMPGGGAIEVSTGRGPAGELRLVVRDGGVGMDARQREHAFDDFFTTKPSGSGLGLAFVRRVAHAHGGEVSLESEVGRGTAVTFVLPVEEP